MLSLLKNYENMEQIASDLSSSSPADPGHDVLSNYMGASLPIIASDLSSSSPGVPAHGVLSNYMGASLPSKGGLPNIQQDLQFTFMDLANNSPTLADVGEDGNLAMLGSNYSKYDGINLHTQVLGNISSHTNESVQTNGDPLMPMDMTFNSSHVLQISCYTVIFVVSLVGNLCVLKAILGGGRKQRKSRVNLMLLHLALADLIVTVVMIPVEVGWAATVQWTAGDTSCRIFSFFRIFGHYLSSFILVCISIDRYFAVVHPLSLNAADRRGKIMLGFAWLLAATCALPQAIIFHIKFHPTFTFYQQCVTFDFYPTIHHEMVYNLFCLIMLYLAPLTIIISFYGAIVFTIFKKSRLTESSIRRSSLGYLGRARARTIKMTISIVGAFFVCWTPYIVISLWFCFDRSSAESLDQRVLKFLFIFACTNSCANPIVYGIFNFCRRKQAKSQTWRSTTLNTQVTTMSASPCRASSGTDPTVVVMRRLRPSASSSSSSDGGLRKTCTFSNYNNGDYNSTCLESSSVAAKLI